MSACLDENTALELVEARLPTGSRSRVERHLEECDACRELVAEVAQMGDETRSPQTAGFPTRDASGPDTERIPFAEGVRLAAGDSVGPYRVEVAVGQGAAGTVYRAVDTRANHVVALKHLTDPALRSRFAREAETLARLNHSGIVRYVDHGEMPGGLYLTMEWLEGEDLARRLERGPLDWASARALGARIAGALAHAHALGCVHRDLSPKNVFLPGGRFDQAKLLDFGLVRVPDPGLDRTASQAVLGTPFYMAPEQVRDPKSVDARADLFGLGVLLFEAVAGQRPFEGTDLFTVWIRIVDQPTPNLRQLVRGAPEAFVRLVEHLLAKDPQMRPATATEVERALLTMDVGSATAIIQTTAPMKRPQTHVMQPLSPASAPKAGNTSNTSPSGAVALSGATTTRPRSGTFLAATVGVGVTVAAMVAGGVYYKRQSARHETPSAEPPGGLATDVNGSRPRNADGTPDGPPPDPVDPNGSDPVAKATTTPSITQVTDADASGPETLNCGAEKVETRHGGRYVPNAGGAAVFAGGDCKLTLEDCHIAGPRALSVLNNASVTLRRCTVVGDVSLIGNGTLHLYETTLPSTPMVVGKARIVQH